MQFEILGPLRVRDATGEVAIKSGRERSLLAVLLLHARRTVPNGRLFEAVWENRPPPGARNQLQGCISRLRRQLVRAGAADRLIVTDPGGYHIAVAPGQLDLLEFRRLVGHARTAAANGSGDEATRAYRAGLELWRGPALADIDTGAARHLAASLDEERVLAQEECIGLQLATGAGGRLVPELLELAQLHPHREGVHRALMLAFHQAGRQGDALAAYRSVRRRLRDELGIEPGPELQRLHQAILNRDPELEVPAAPAAPVSRVVGKTSPEPVPRPRELPADVPEFTGRADALKQLGNLLTGVGPGQPGPVIIAVINGTAGVGKTALAVHWAHQVAGQFPDGQLYLDLRGHAAGEPLRPVDALAWLLRSLGVSPDQIPADEVAAAARFRSQLAGRRVMVVLDNAGSADQVRPLLPGSPGCLVLATSRNHLSGLVARDGARTVELDVFTQGEAQDLLARLIAAERVAAEPEASRALAGACAQLALALRIAAAHIAERPHQTIARYVSELTTGDPLATLRAGDDDTSAVWGAFELSYHAIPAPAQRLFRLLGLVPGPDVTPPAAAALTATTVENVQRLLRRLVSSHLIEEHAPDRYTFHDLLRRFATRLTEAGDRDDERAAALGRLLDSYLYTADRAANLLHPQMLRLSIPPPESAPAVSLAGLTDALVWLDAERTNLIAAIVAAARNLHPSQSWLLADRLRGYFWQGRLLPDWTRAAGAALAAAERHGDPQAQAAAHFSLAHLCQTQARYPDALAHYDAAVGLAGQAGWTHSQAAAQTNLGMIRQDLGQLAQSAGHHRRGLQLNRDRGDLGGQAVNLVNLGVIDRECGRLRDAVDHLSQALDFNRELGYRHGEAVALHSLGRASLDLGDLDRARKHLTEALAQYRDTGDRSGVAASLQELGSVCETTGRRTEAAELARQALTLAAEIGDRQVEAGACTTLGELHHQEPEAALNYHRQALELARHAGSRRTETVALLGLAAAQRRNRDLVGASTTAQEALEHARAIGYRVLEGQATTLLAEILHSQREYGMARERVEQALEIHRETRHRIGQARTLTVLGHIEDATGSRQDARRAWRAAYDLFAEIGVPVPDELADRLNPG
ncbi:MAG: tetratricopeptide repeat protein [Micromonosporaceae bacterium]|nr:tetratricopeptide repeat protein [Micromonosporaceae bacterium]